MDLLMRGKKVCRCFGAILNYVTVGSIINEYIRVPSTNNTCVALLYDTII